MCKQVPTTDPSGRHPPEASCVCGIRQVEEGLLETKIRCHSTLALIPGEATPAFHLKITSVCQFLANPPRKSFFLSMFSWWKVFTNQQDQLIMPDSVSTQEA